MKLADHDLLQMDEAYLESLDPDRLRAVSKKLLSDLKESRERLNQNSQNSSVPPSSRPAYLGTLVGSDDQEETSSEDEGDPPSKKGKLEIDPTEDSHKSDAVAESGTTEQSVVTKDGKNVGGKAGSNSPEPKKAGKQLGAQGYGRTQVIPHNKLEEHRATQCSACGEDLPHDAPFVAKTGFRVIDIKQNDDGQWGIELECVLHHFGETECGCGHRTLVMPGRGDILWTAQGRVFPETGKLTIINLLPHAKNATSGALKYSHESANTSLSEWRLIGPRLASFIVFLTFRMRLSRARVKEFLWEWLGLQLATGTIDNCIRESALAALPIYTLARHRLRFSRWQPHVNIEIS